MSKRLRCRLGIHRWLLTSLQLGRWKRSGGDVTLLLMRCGCGAVQTETLEGHWTLEELTRGAQR